MAINLQKGQAFNLTKNSASLKTVRAELGWNTPTNKFPKFDLDVSLFGLINNAAGEPKLIDEDYFMFYNHANKVDDTTPITNNDGALVKSPDETSGGVEWLKINLDKVNPAVDELSLIVTIHEAHKRNQTFNYVDDAYIALFDDVSGEEMTRYDLDEAFSTETAVQIGSLTKSNGEWTFTAVGVGYNLELGDFVEGYTS
jgi:tellurium resistance protein TerD